MEEGWAHGSDRIDFIADDEGEVAFIDYRVNDGYGFADEKVDREVFEHLAAAYLTEHGDIPDSHVRFDVVSMLIPSEDKGLLRRHLRNAFRWGLEISGTRRSYSHALCIKRLEIRPS